MSNESLRREQSITHMGAREQLYTTMAREADGFYKQIITICTAFLGGTLVFYKNLFISGRATFMLFGGWLALTYPLAVLVCVRWKNVEAHRHALEYFKTENEQEYAQAVAIPKKSRKWTVSAIISMILGLVLIAAFAAINIIGRNAGR